MNENTPDKAFAEAHRIETLWNAAGHPIVATVDKEASIYETATILIRHGYEVTARNGRALEVHKPPLADCSCPICTMQDGI